MRPEPIQPPQKSGAGPAFALVCIAAYGLLILVGYAVFRSESAMVRGNEMSRDRAFFTVINAATLTGFQQTVATNEYLPPGQWMILLLVIGGALFTLILGGMAATRIARLPYTDGQIAVTSLAMVVTAMIVGGAFLAGANRPFFNPPAAMLQAVSALGNCGLFIGQLPAAFQWQTHALLMPLAILGAFGAPVLLDLRYRITRRQPISPFTRIVLLSTAAVYLIGMLLILWTRGAGLTESAIAAASVDVINSRTTGFPFEYAHAFARPMQWAYLLLMLIGGSSAGTAGGIKVNTLAELARGAVAAFNGRPPGRAFSIAMIWTALYGIALIFWLLLMLDAVPQMPADRLLFIVASALSNVGLSHDPVAIVKEGLNLLSLMMLCGRLLPLAILWWMAVTAKEAEMPVG